MVYSLEQIRGIITPIAEKYGIPAVYLFGSYARGNAGEESDIDFLLDTTGVNLRGFAWGGLYNDFADAFEKPVDLVTLDAIKQQPRMPSEQHFKENVMSERRVIYAVS